MKDADSSLSFLDTLSCGLGGVMVLFIIFAALNDKGAPISLDMPVEVRSKKVMKVTSSGDAKPQPLILKLSWAKETGCELSSNAVFYESSNYMQNSDFVNYIGVIKEVNDSDKELTMAGECRDTKFYIAEVNRPSPTEFCYRVNNKGKVTFKIGSDMLLVPNDECGNP